MYRCTNDFMGYCSDTPVWKVKPKLQGNTVIGEGYEGGGTCKLSPETCGKYQRFSDQVSVKPKKQRGK